jgi:hypothetical protein
MQKRSARDTAVPAPLLKTAPRDVRVNTSGALMYMVAGALIIAGVWGSVYLTSRAQAAGRRIRLFESERVVTAGDVIRLRKRGGDEGHRITAHYRYTARGQELMGETRLRREENDRYAVGSPVAVWYLESEPDESWLDGYGPRLPERWPATIVLVACGVAAIVMLYAVRRQKKLLAYGRPAMATVTKVEKKATDKGTVWMVHYEFTTLTGATRVGKFHHGKKNLPAIGDSVPVVYDRDDSHRHSKYPMGFVKVEVESR